MSRNKVVIYDAVNFVPVSVPTELKDWVDNFPAGRSVNVHLKATHSGKVTANNSFYLPDKMRGSVSSWLQPFAKPILRHHPEKSSLFSGDPSAEDRDPIGRVVEAEYVDIVENVQQYWQANIKTDSLINSNLLDAFNQGKLSFRESCEVVDKHFINNIQVVNDPNYEGLGYIELIANISDEKAAQKVLDGRYLTGSIGATTDKAVCSICKTDWANNEEGPCDHRPGQTYDDQRCVLIAGNFGYKEYSFVNMPADNFSGVIGIQTPHGSQFVHAHTEDSERIPEITLTMSSQEDESMKLEDILALLKEDERFAEVEDLENKLQPLLDNEELTPEGVVDEAVRLILPVKKDADPPEETEKKEEVVEDNEGPVDKVREFWGEDYDEIVSDDETRDYATVLFEMVQEASPEEREAIELMVRDAKLSTKKREALSGSTFCGPKRSFPVPDCAHVTAARRLVGRYKGPGDKSKILACVSRKAKRLGCGGSKSDSVGQFTVEYFDMFDDDQIRQMTQGLLAVYEDRDMNCPSLSDKAKVEALEAEVALLQESANPDLQEKLDKTLEDLEDTNAEIEALTESNKELHKRISGMLSDRIIFLTKLVDSSKSEEEVLDELKDMDVDNLSDKVKELIGLIDMGKVSGKVGSGLTQESVEKVQNPTATGEGIKEGQVQLTDQQLKERYNELNRKYGPAIAEKFKHKQIELGNWTK